MIRRKNKLYLTLFAYLMLWAGLLATAMPGTVSAQEQQTARDSIHLLTIRGVINPPVSSYLQRGLQDAASENARLVIIQLDTPGGLDTSMREMTQAILASPVPVVVYVSPAGSRAASAGLFLLVSSHVAAMAPSTNTGAAHPVGLGGGEADEVMVDKVVHDAAATIRTLAEQRGRNAAWSERAVRESVSITEEEALELNVIDIVARNLDHLLEQIHGRSVQTAAGEVVLDVLDAPIYDAPMTFAENLLHVISTPDIAFILLSIGTIGLIAELYNPGTFIPGIAGLLALIFAFFALGNLPTNWAGVAFIVLAIVLLVAELNTDGTGVLGIGATIAFLLGGLILFRPLRTPSPVLPDLSVNPWLLAVSTVILGAMILLVASQLARTRHAPVLTGIEHYIGQLARVHQDLAPRGRVWFDSQLWYAESHQQQPIVAQQAVRIVGVDGLTLIVEPASSPSDQAPAGGEFQAHEKPRLDIDKTTV